MSSASPRETHNLRQRAYYESSERARILPVESPYVLAHLERMIATADLSPGQRILEVGAGLGKFTLPLAARGLQVTANDLSPRLLERLDGAAGGRIETLCCDIHDIERQVQQGFDRVIGFFVLHHLMDLEDVFAALTAVLRPGGRMAFCEPVAWNPLYYVQILLTPNMRFAGEPSLSSMRPGVILPAMAQAGLVKAERHGYGYFPPAIRNRAVGERMERWLEARPVPFPNAFQTFSALRPG